MLAIPAFPRHAAIGTLRGTMRYRGFISYSHADIRSAEWLFRKLQSYRLPSRVAAKDKRRLGSFFLDRETLAAASDLTDALKEGLAQSEALIVLCSKEAAASKWVNQEIDAFRQARPDGKIITVLAESLTPSAEDKTSFPTRLLENNQEPLAADISGRGFDRQLGFLKLVAALTEIPLDDLLQRDAQRRNRRVTAVTVASALIAITMTALAGAALTAREEARAQRAEAEDLVDFMLGDLRDRLEPVGRLDVLDGVATRSLEYFSQYDDSELSCDQAHSKATAMQLAARVGIRTAPDLETIEKAAETKKLTDRILSHCGENFELLLIAAASEFYIGDAWLNYLRAKQVADNKRLAPEDLQKVESHFTAYYKMALSLFERNPDDSTARQELAYAFDNLAAAAYYAGDFNRALELSQSANPIFRQLSENNPSDPQKLADLLDNMSWLSAYLVELDRLHAAEQLRLQQLGMFEVGLRNHPNNWSLKRRRLSAEIRLLELYIAQAKLEEASQQYTIAEQYLAELISFDLENTELRVVEEALGKFPQQIQNLRRSNK